MGGVSERSSDLWIGAGLLGFCGFAAWRTTYIREGISSSAAGPSFVPWLMIGLIALLSIVMVVRALRQGHPGEHISMPGARTLLAMGAFALLLFVYAAAFMPLGYLPSTIVAFVLGLLLLGERNWLVVVLYPVALTFAVWFGFTRFLGVWLP